MLNTSLKLTKKLIREREKANKFLAIVWKNNEELTKCKEENEKKIVVYDKLLHQKNAEIRALRADNTELRMELALARAENKKGFKQSKK